MNEVLSELSVFCDLLEDRGADTVALRAALESSLGLPFYGSRDIVGGAGAGTACPLRDGRPLPFRFDTGVGVCNSRRSSAGSGDGWSFSVRTRREGCGILGDSESGTGFGRGPCYG